MPMDWRKPPFKARTKDTSATCNCALYINDERISRMIVGEVLVCEACRSAIWLDDQSRLFDPEGLKIRYAYDTKWLVVRFWYLDFWYQQAMENGLYVNYKRKDSGPHYRARRRDRGERSSKPSGAAVSSMLRTGHP